jgi:transposase
MPRAYAEDLRSRVIAAVEAGRSAREAARVLQVSPSAAIKWVQRWRRSGSVAAKPMAGNAARHWIVTPIICWRSLPRSPT